MIVMLTACTNATSDKPLRITLKEDSKLKYEDVAKLASKYLSKSGYKCEIVPYYNHELECKKILNKWPLHNRYAKIKLQRPNKIHPYYRLIATRWDEGIIPNELLADSYVNDDIHKFCLMIKREKIANC